MVVALVLLALVGPSGAHSAPAAQSAAQPAAQSAATWQVLGEGAQLRSPMGVAVDVVGNIYVADAGNHRVVKLSPEGRQVAAWGSQGTAPGQFDAPSGIAVDGAGYVYVADTFNQRIQKLTPDGQPVFVVGEAGSGPGQFRDPHAVAVDPEGTMYVVDTYNDRVQKLSPDGEVLADWGGPAAAEAWDGAADQTGQMGDQLDGQTGDQARAEPYAAPSGRDVDAFSHPKGIATDVYGRLVVADTDNLRIVTLSAQTGQLLAIWSSPGTAPNGDAVPGAYRGPRGVAVDVYGQVYVADTYSHRVQLLTADGAPLAQWGAEGGAPGELRVPSGLALDAAGALYVADTGNHRIQRLVADGE